MKALILDASALITGFGPDSDINAYTVREVVDEIKNRDLKLKVELSLDDKSLKIVEPSSESLADIKKTAVESGDISALSDADLKVIALAWDLREEGHDVSIMTDDYGIQNVASIRGLAYTPAAEMGIKRVIIWKNICRACGKEFPADFKGECTDCGSEVRTVRKTTKRVPKEP